MALMPYACKGFKCTECGQMVLNLDAKCKDCKNKSKSNFCTSCRGTGNIGGFVCGRCVGDGFT